MTDDERKEFEKEIIAGFRKAARERNKKQVMAWRERNKEKYRAYMREYSRKRYWDQKIAKEVAEG